MTESGTRCVNRGGGRLGQSLTAIAKLAPNAKIGTGLSVHYSGKLGGRCAGICSIISLARITLVLHFYGVPHWASYRNDCKQNEDSRNCSPHYLHPDESLRHLCVHHSRSVEIHVWLTAVFLLWFWEGICSVRRRLHLNSCTLRDNFTLCRKNDKT